MPYTPRVWQDNPAGGTAIDAANLNRIETGIDAVTDTAEAAKAAIDGLPVNGVAFTGPVDFAEPPSIDGAPIEAYTEDLTLVKSTEERQTLVFDPPANYIPKPGERVLTSDADGLPKGGAAGTLLVKTGGADYASGWRSVADLNLGGGGGAVDYTKVAPLVPALEGVRAWAAGNSAGNLQGSGNFSPGAAYHQRVLKRLDLYEVNNWHVNSQCAQDTFGTLLGTGAAPSYRNFPVEFKGFLMLVAFDNDFAAFGNSVDGKRGTSNAAVGLLSLGRAASRVEADASGSSGADWTTVSAPQFSDGSYLTATTVGATRTFPVTSGTDMTLILAGGKTATDGTSFEVTVDGVVKATGSTKNQYRPSPLNTGGGVFHPYPVLLRNLGAGPHTVAVRHVGTAGETLGVNVLLPWSPSPKLTLMSKPARATAAAYASVPVSPKPTDATVAEFGGIVQTAANLFPDDGACIIVDPNALGWDPTIHCEPDGKHPSDRGTAFIAGLIVNAVRNIAFRLGLNAGIVGAEGTTTVDTTPPSLTIVSPTTGSSVNGVVQLVANASDTSGGVQSVTWKAGSTIIGAADDQGGGNWTLTFDTATLSPGLYTFNATATDASGNTTSRSVNATVTAPTSVTVPGAPTGLAGTAADTQIVNTWTAPASNGGAPITDYVLQVRTAAVGGTPAGAWGTVTDGVSPSTGATVTGLTQGTAYEERVAAVNSAGQGPFSATLSKSTTGTVPPAPGTATAWSDSGAGTEGSTPTTTTTGGKTWQTLGTGVTWKRTGNLLGPASGGMGVLVVDSGSPDGRLTARIGAVGERTGGLAFRVQDGSNFLIASLRSSTTTTYLRLTRVVNGVGTAISASGPTSQNDDVLEVDMNGTSLTFFLNGANLLTITESTYSTQTKHGLYGNFQSAPSVRWADVTYTP